MSPDDLRPGDVVPRRVIDPDDLEPGMVVEWQRSRPTFEGQDPNPSRRVSRPIPDGSSLSWRTSARTRS